jgi:hypothetical protein
MAPKKNEQTSKKMAKIASDVLRKGKATAKQARSLAGALLTQAADKPKPRKPGK